MHIIEKLFKIHFHCNCKQKENCLMNDACLKEIVVYYPTIRWDFKNYKPKLCKGSCETSLCTKIMLRYQRSIGTWKKTEKPTDFLKDKSNI